MMTIERITAEIRRAYSTHTTQYGQGAWMSMQNLATRVDLTGEQIAEGVRHLARTDDRCNIAPESNQKTLTKTDIDLAVWFGGQWVHLISWS